MPQPALPSGVSQSELDEIFAAQRILGQSHLAEWNKARIPQYIQDQWDWVVQNPGWLSATRTAIGDVKATSGRLLLVVVNTVGTPGTLLITDGAITLYTAPAASLVAGQVIQILAECYTKITLASLPTGGSYTFVYA